MKNIEKYEKEIKNKIKENGTFDCAIKGVRGHVCDEDFRCTDCGLKSLDWLLEEYKEPTLILTDKEKAYLKNVIEPKKDDVLCIRKWRFYEGTKQEYTTVTIYEKHPTSTSDNSYWTLLDFVVTEEMPFKGMELQEQYTLEELGL